MLKQDGRQGSFDVFLVFVQHMSHHRTAPNSQAVATVLGPLLEIPVMLALVKVAQCLAGEEEEQET